MRLCNVDGNSVDSVSLNTGKKSVDSSVHLYLCLLRVDAIAQRIDRALMIAHFVERSAAELTRGRNVALKHENL